jgi:ankyrin repeat protein
LEEASIEGHVEVARVLLEHGADAKALDPNNGTPLHVAQGEVVARLLIEHGADANAVDIDGQTPLHSASVSGHAGVARVLLEHGADANSRDDDNATPLHLASDYKLHIHGELPDVVLLLLQYNSDIHARDNEGQTPFMIARANGYHDVMQVLLENGAEDEDEDD